VGLHDEMENPRVTMGVDKNGGGVILIDEKGQPRLAMGVGEGGSNLSLMDAKGTPRVSLAASKDGPSVLLVDEKGTRRAVLGSVPLESAPTGSKNVTAPSSLTLLDNEGNVAWKAP